MQFEAATTLRERWSVSSKLTAFEVWLRSFAGFREVPGNHNQCLFVHSRDGRGTYLTSLEDLAKSAQIGLAFYSDPDAVMAFQADAIAAGRAYRHAAADVSRDVADLDGAALAERFRRLFAANIRCMAHYKITGDEFSVECEKRLQEELKPLGDETNRVLLDALSGDEGELDVTAERRAWLGMIRRRLGTRSLDEREIAAHAARFGYLGAMGGNPSGWNAAYYRARLERPLDQLQYELHELERAEAESRQRLVARETAERQLELFPWCAMVVAHLRECTVNRMYVRECFTSAANASNPLFRELYRRVSEAGICALDDPALRQLSMTDIDVFLRTGGLAIDEVRSRQAGFMMTLNGAEPVLLDGPVAAVPPGFTLPSSTLDAERTLTGRTVWGSKPLVGRAFVLDTGLLQSRKMALIASMRSGDILVTGMTHPNIVEACERASAIVTDEGGLTCHAAIIAREINIPCIVATERATRMFRTGDLIELDPGTGTVRIRELEGAMIA